MTVTTEEMIAICIAKLKSEGIDAFMGADPENEANTVLLAPSLQNPAGEICQMRVYGYLSCKLGGQKRKGLLMRHPVSGAPYDIYCYDSLESVQEAPDASELMVWSVHDGHPFDWTELSIGDAGWDNGWELLDCEHIEQRLAFLTYLSTCEMIDLPDPKPLTVDELRSIASSEISKGEPGRFCYAPNPSNQWHLKLDDAGDLVMSMSESQQQTKITAEHFDAQGRLVINGHIALTRSTPL